MDGVSLKMTNKNGENWWCYFQNQIIKTRENEWRL
jgi:hypothetical protein